MAPHHELKLMHELCTASILAPCVPYSTQRGEERRVSSMLSRTEMASQAQLHRIHPSPFVLGKWQHPVAPLRGIRKTMFESAQCHTRPTGTGLSDASLRKLYNRQVRNQCSCASLACLVILVLPDLPASGATSCRLSLTRKRGLQHDCTVIPGVALVQHTAVWSQNVLLAEESDSEETDVCRGQELYTMRMPTLIRHPSTGTQCAAPTGMLRGQWAKHGLHVTQVTAPNVLSSAA